MSYLRHSEGSVAEQVDGHQQRGDRGHVVIIAEETWPQGQEAMIIRSIREVKIGSKVIFGLIPL